MPAAAAMSRVVVPWKPFSAKASTAAASSRARVAPAREGAPVIAPPSDPHAWLTRHALWPRVEVSKRSVIGRMPRAPHRPAHRRGRPVSDRTTVRDDLRQRVAAFLAEPHPARTDRLEFLRARFDAGLAWVFFPPGYGGLGLPRALQP